MIYTLTINPSIDYYLWTDELVTNETLRAQKAVFAPGGKGISSATILGRLGMPVTPIVMAGGDTGMLLQSLLISEPISAEYIDAEVPTRINVKISDQNGHYELNAPGLPLGDEAMKKLASRLSQLQKGDWLILSGSLPEHLADDFYAKIVRELSIKGIKVGVDTSGPALKVAIKEHPAFIKPNEEEAAALFNIPFDPQNGLSEQQIENIFCQLTESGVERVIITLGAKGSIYGDNQGNRFRFASPQVKVVATVGCGDSFVGGFVYGLVKYDSPLEAMAYGTASGAATAATQFLGDKTAIEEIRKKVILPKK